MGQAVSGSVLRTDRQRMRVHTGSMVAKKVLFSASSVLESSDHTLHAVIILANILMPLKHKTAKLSDVREVFTY